jgi:catalase
MQPENGWFQLESQQPVNAKSSGRGTVAGNATRTGPPKPDNSTNARASSPTYSQAPAAGNKPNTYVAPKAEPPLANDFATTGLPAPKQAIAPASNRQPATPNAYGNRRDIGSTMQWASFNWADEMALHTRHAQTVGARGPVLEQDSILHEALQIFINKKIPERPVHTKGFGAFGLFQTFNSMREFTTLPFLQSPGQQVPVMVRFSLAVSNKGTPDTSRNVRGFSTKFYAREGVFDLLCNHIPVLFVRDGLRFPEAITSLMPSPVNNLPDPEQLWAFVSRAPEAMHFVTWLYSDVGTVKSFRHIQGHSVNTYVWRNAMGARRYVKYHWQPVDGEETITREEAAMLAGADPDIAGRDLFDTIASGQNVQYNLYVQLMDPKDESTLPYDPLDCTKVWDERQYPMIPVGRLTLNRNPDNYTEQVEKAAFSPANLLEGAELSDDKLLQARANIYWDSQRRRLGEDFRGIPVNDQADWTPDHLVSSGAGTYAEGELVRLSIPDPDDFTQAGERYLSLSPEEQTHLVDNLAADLARISARVRDMIIAYLSAASEELGQRVFDQLLANMRR